MAFCNVLMPFKAIESNVNIVEWEIKCIWYNYIYSVITSIEIRITPENQLVVELEMSLKQHL